MTDFDARAFPYIFSCRCGAEQEVTRRDCIEHAPHMDRPADAAEFVVKAKYGWAPVDAVRVQCPDCATPRPEAREGPDQGQAALFAG